MATPADNDLVPNPIRAAAVPTLDVVASGLSSANRLIQPAWVRITEALVKWIRFHFSAATRIEHPDLIDRVWTAEPSSPIFISSLSDFAPVSGQMRPSILIDRLDQEKDMQQRAIGDQFQGGQQLQFAHFMQGRHVVHCIGGHDGESELLAMETWRELVRFAPVLREKLCLMRLLPLRIGKRVQIQGESGMHYSIPIELSYGYQEAWRVSVLDEDEITAIQSVLSTL